MDLEITRQMAEEGLRELADAGYQQRAWMGEIPGVQAYFDLCIEHLFEDSGLDRLLERHETVFGDADDRLRELDSLVSHIDGGRPPEEILDDPLLPQARSLAQQILELIG